MQERTSKIAPARFDGERLSFPAVSNLWYSSFQTHGILLGFKLLILSSVSNLWYSPRVQRPGLRKIYSLSSTVQTSGVLLPVSVTFSRLDIFSFSIRPFHRELLTCLDVASLLSGERPHCRVLQFHTECSKLTRWCLLDVATKLADEIPCCEPLGHLH